VAGLLQTAWGNSVSPFVQEKRFVLRINRDALSAASGHKLAHVDAPDFVVLGSTADGHGAGLAQFDGFGPRSLAASGS
jgi:hypothetical protein